MKQETAEQAFDRLYREWGPMVLRRCRTILRDENLAVDAMQDSFVQVLRRRDSLDLSRPSSLLYRIATNTCLNLIRSKTRRREDMAGDPIQEIAWLDPRTENAEARDLVDRLFETEEESTRTMAMLHFVDGWTYEQVGAETGLSVSGVRKRLRGLKARAAAHRASAMSGEMK